MKFRCFSFLLVIFILFVFQSCAPQKMEVDIEEVRAEIERGHKEFCDLFNKKNIEGLAKFIDENFKSDAVILPPRAKIIEGRDAIKKFWLSGIDQGITNLELKTEKLFVFYGVKGEEYDYLVYEIGKYSYEITLQRAKEEVKTDPSGYFIGIRPHRNDCTELLQILGFNEVPLVEEVLPEE